MCRKNVLPIVAVVMLVLAIGQGQVAWGGITQLSDAMSDLTDHINGTTPLTDQQLDSVASTINANKSSMDDNTTIMTEAFDLSTLYDTVVGPLFINAETTNGFPKVGGTGYELERAIFLVQQSILDVIYTPANISTYDTFLDGRILETSDFFPGACTPPVDPEVSYNVDINGTNATEWGKTVCYGTIPCRRPTGCYLAPGSIGEVTVPSAIVNQGFEILVGAHMVDKEEFSKPNYKRLDRVFKTFPITSTVTTIANPLGGGVYIRVPYEADFGTRTVSIKNVVLSPYFAATITNQTTLQQWTDTERNHPAPWADFETDLFMMNVPTSWIYNYADPVSQLQDWDTAMEAFSEILGYVAPHHVRNTAVLYVQVDRDIKHGAYGTGYPQINQTYNPNNSTNGDQNHFFLRDVIGWSTLYHEAGHCQLFSKFPGHAESSVNFPYVYVATQYFGVPLVDAFTKSMVLQYLENIDVDQAALTWFVTENFRNGNPMDITNSTKNEVRYQHRGYGRLVEIGELYGWDVISDFYYQEHLDYMSPPPGDGLHSTDSRIFRLSKAAGVDLRALIHTWGVQPVNQNNLETAIEDEGLPQSEILRDRLIYYKSIIPANNAEFWDHYTTIYPSQPSGGNPDYQFGWYNVWKEIYDTAEGTAAKAAMQDIIDLYFDPPPSTVPWSDGLESGNFSGGGWVTQNGDASVSAQAANSGGYGAKLKKTTWIEKAVTTVGSTNIHVKYYRQTSGFDSGENIYVEWYDGTQWNNLETIQNASYGDGLQDKTCGAGADENPLFKVRFRTNADKANEYAYVDDVQVVTGGGGCTATDMHIESVVCAEVNCGQGNKNGQVTVTIYNDCGNPVSGALVDVTFTGDYSETIYDVATNGSGVAVITTSGCIKKPAFTATVIDVTGTLPYDSNDNVTDNCSG